MIDVLWLADLFEDLPGSFEVRCFRDSDAPGSRPAVTFCSSLDELEVTLTDADNREHENVYMAMATRDAAGSPLWCRALWVEVDFARERGSNWNEREREGAVLFEDRCARFPLPPSIVVDSGGGRHAYWVLADPIDLASNTVALFEALAGLRAWWQSEAGAVDAARALRVPGTRNWPDAAKRRKGRATADSSAMERTTRRYALEDFAPFLAHAAVAASAEPLAPARDEKREHLEAVIEMSVEDYAELFREGDAAEQMTLARDTPDALVDVIERYDSALASRLREMRASAVTIEPDDVIESVRSVMEIDAKVRALFLRDEKALPVRHQAGGDLDVLDRHLMLALLSHPTLTREQVISTAKTSRRKSGALDRLEDYWDRSFSAALAHMRRGRGEEEPPGVDDWPAYLRWILRSRRAKTITAQELDMVSEASPRFPIGLPHFDDGPAKGAYGFTSVSGSEGVGKSLLMLTAGMAAATMQHDPWTSIYFDAENAPNIVNQRIQRWWNLPVAEIRQRLANFHRFWVPNGSASIGALREFTCSCIDRETKKVLIIIDSINTVCDKMARSQGSHYFTLMRELLMWLQDARVESGGQIACITTSELNQKKNMKGEKIAYTIDCGFRITEKKRSEAYEIDMHKSRDTARPSKAVFRIDQRHARFIPVGELEPVAGGHQIALDGARVISMQDRKKEKENWWDR